MKFYSSFKEVGKLEFPEYASIRVQLMPVILHDRTSLPPLLEQWKRPFLALCEAVKDTHGTAYLTIDESEVKSGETHRRPGLHVDGMGAWGKGGGWGVNGMLMASSLTGCAAWKQEFEGEPLHGDDVGDPKEGSCEHLRSQALDSKRRLLLSKRIYWCSPLCVHESLPFAHPCKRTFVRLSMPSDSAWPANCTQNPLGIQPTGTISVPRRTEGRYSYA
jgi:hypothetical protein